MEPALATLRARVDAELAAFLADERARLARVGGARAALLADEIARLVAAGGKRLRAAFCYWGHRAGAGTDSAAIIRTGAALELFHLFALVHDDIMDASTLRRGVPAAHVHLGGWLRDDRDAVDFGRSAAILVGDTALALGIRLFEQSGFPPPKVFAGNQWLHAMRTEALAGQFLELVDTYTRHGTEQGALTVAALKSAGYSVQKPLLLGLSLAPHVARGAYTALQRYGGWLGIAFQLRDDLLGTFGEEENTGKDVSSDISTGKPNTLVTRALALADARQRAFLDAQLRASEDQRDVQAVRAVIEATGAAQDVERWIGELRRRAVAELDGSVLGIEPRDALEELADCAAIRRS